MQEKVFNICVPTSVILFAVHVKKKSLFTWYYKNVYQCLSVKYIIISILEISSICSVDWYIRKWKYCQN